MITSKDTTHAQNLIRERIVVKSQSGFLNNSYDVHGDSYSDYFDVPYGDYYDTNSEEPH